MELELHLLEPVGEVVGWGGGGDGAHEDRPLVCVVWIEARRAAVGVDGFGVGAVDLRVARSVTITRIVIMHNDGLAVTEWTLDLDSLRVCVSSASCRVRFLCASDT